MVNERPFGISAGGEPARLFALTSGEASCEITTYGGALASLTVPDKNGKPIDVVLGYDTLEDYERQDKYMGAIVGRYANRIGGSRFTLGGEEYTLFPNEGENHLHGGKTGFDKRVWEAHPAMDRVRLTLESPHMDEGYPGMLSVNVTYTLSGGALTIDYEAVSDRDTVCNLTNHAYFNLAGHASGSILGHVLNLHAARYTPVADAGSIPTGEIVPVEGTPMDFRVPTVIGERIDENFDQLRFGTGYDHNWVLDGEADVLRKAAEVYCPESGIVMEVCTTMPGIQFYAGNFLSADPAGKGGASYEKRTGFCLETQFYPDSPNRPEFPQPVLRAGGQWRHTTVFKFGVR